jgi:nitrile hydratase
VTALLETDAEKLLVALRTVLAAKGIATTQEIAERVAITDAGSPAQGARIPMRGAPPLGVLENTPGRHNVVVCTLCSCYPRAVLGYPPFWFKSAAYRARAVRDPRGLLQEWGTVLPDTVQVQVVDSTADYRWMVLPMRPPGTEGWSEEKLATIVREGDMIGVTIPTAG